MVEGRKLLLAGLRAAMALALIGSVYWQIFDRVSHNVFRPTEYFSYFTVTSCILSAVVLALGSLEIFRSEIEPKLMTIARLTMACSMVVVGVIYNALLANAAPDPRDIGYVWPVLPNLVMHTYMPILILLEWLLASKVFNLQLMQSFWVLVYPRSWLAFSLVRGAITGWWAYWFINPAYGLGTVLTWIGVISAFFIVLALALNPLQKLITGLYNNK